MAYSPALPSIVWACVGVGGAAALVIFVGFAVTYYRAWKYAKDLSCSVAPAIPGGGYDAARRGDYDAAPAYGKPAPPPSSTYKGDGTETASTEYDAAPPKDYGAGAPKDDYGQGKALPAAVVSQACGLYEREQGAPPSSDADALELLRKSVSAELSSDSCASQSEVREAARAYAESAGAYSAAGAGRPLAGTGYGDRERLQHLKAGLDGALVTVAPHEPAPMPAPPALTLPPPPAASATTSATSADVAGVQEGDYKGKETCEA